MTEPTDPVDPTEEIDPTEDLDPTTAYPKPPVNPAHPADVDPDRVDQSEVLRFMARRALIWGLPLILVGILLVALGLPSWVIVIALAAAMVVVVFEVEI